MFDTLIVQPIFNLLLGLYTVVPGGDFGVSLILFTIIVRMALWPLVKKQLHQTKAIKKLQPELAKIKKKANGNKQVQGMLMLEAYKKHGISPFRSIGILLIQLPIFIALYRVIQIITTDRERVAEFAYSFTEKLPPIKAIIDNPASFNETLFGVVDLTETAISPSIPLLLIALAAAGLQYYMAKQTTPATDSDKRLRDVLAATAEGQQPDQSEVNAIVMRKMLKVLPVFLFFIIISLPGALALYFAVSNLTAVLQQRYILNKDEGELEAAADRQTAKDRAKKAQKAEVVAPAKPKQPKQTKATKPAKPAKSAKSTKASSATKVTRISAKDTSKKTKRR